MSTKQQIPEIEIKNWNAFEAYYEEHFAKEWGRWGFRGQSDAAWKLETKIERALSSILNHEGPKPYPIGIGGVPVAGLRSRLELFFIKAFQSRARLLLRECLPEDTLTLLSLMQHWGYPTRLLDFTTSPYVGLHFALAPAFRDPNSGPDVAALFAVHSVPLRSLSSTNVLRAKDLITERQWDHTKELDFSTPSNFDELFFGSLNVPFVAPVHPRVVHERIVSQQGTFLCPSNIDQSFERNLLALVESEDFPADQAVRKLIFPRSAALDIFPRLVKMNIHEASLFPDLEGHARFVMDTIAIFKGISDGKWLVALEGMEKLNWLG